MCQMLEANRLAFCHSYCSTCSPQGTFLPTYAYCGQVLQATNPKGVVMFEPRLLGARPATSTGKAPLVYSDSRGQPKPPSLLGDPLEFHIMGFLICNRAGTGGCPFGCVSQDGQGARKDHEFQSRLRVMDIDEAAKVQGLRTRRFPVRPNTRNEAAG